MTAGANRARNARAIQFGRFMLPDSSEHACRVTQLSPDGAVFITGIEPPPGVGIVAYVDGIGRVEAITGEPREGGFAVSFQISSTRRERIDMRLRSIEDGPEAHPRKEETASASHITLPDGRVYPCAILDVSIAGALVDIHVLPALGTRVLLGRMRGRVVRHLDSGIAIDFAGQPDQA